MKTRTDLAHWVVIRAAHAAPPQLADRLEEEWLADLAARKGTAARLRFAFGCHWATRVIAHDHIAANTARSSARGTASATANMTAAATGSAAASAAAVGPPPLAGAIDLTFRSAGPSGPSRSGRFTALAVIVGLHVGLIYALASGLAQNVIVRVTDPLIATFRTEATPVEKTPPLPPPVFEHTRPEIPDNGVVFDVPGDDGILGVVTSNPAPVADPLPPQPSHAVTRVIGGPGKGFPATDDYYPATARRAGEAGLSIVQVCVDAHGRLTSDPRVSESSGSARLDDGALKLARAGSGRYRPSTEDGRSVDSCYAFRIRFQLRD